MMMLSPRSTSSRIWRKRVFASEACMDRILDQSIQLVNSTPDWTEISISICDKPPFGQLKFWLHLRLQPGVGELDQDVSFYIDGSAGCQGMEVGAPVGQGQDGNRDLLAIDIGDCEADAFDCNRALRDHPMADILRYLHLEGPVGGLVVKVRAGGGYHGIEGGECSRAVHMPLHHMAAERTSGCGWEFQVDLGPWSQGT